MRCFQQGFWAYRSAGGSLHPEVGGDAAHLGHALELWADASGLFHLFFNLKCDGVADWVIGEIKERVDHVGVDSEQDDIVLVEDGCVVTVPDVFRDLHRGCVELLWCGLRMVVHPVPDGHIDNDFTLLQGVPNTAFTEALAFVFQGHDLELLGLPAPDAKSQGEKTLNDFWSTYEIGGVALVDMAVWHWMYDHPQATPKQLDAATVQISKDIWNRYYAPVFHKNDVVLLGIYSHMIDSFLYLPDYPIGHTIAFQIEEQMKKAGSIGPEFERMAKMGRITPDLWMERATGRPVGPEALLEATQQALATAH